MDYVWHVSFMILGMFHDYLLRYNIYIWYNLINDPRLCCGLNWVFWQKQKPRSEWDDIYHDPQSWLVFMGCLFLTLVGGSAVSFSRKKQKRVCLVYAIPIGSMVLVYMLTWMGYIDGIHVTIYSIHGSYGIMIILHIIWTYWEFC